MAITKTRAATPGATRTVGGTFTMMRNVAFLLGGNVASWSATLVLWLFLPRLMGPGIFGELTLGFAIAGLAISIGGLGIGTYLFKQVARDPEHAAGYVGTGLATQLMLAALILPAVFIFTLLAHYSPHTRAVVLLLTGSALCFFVVTPAASALQALEEMHLNTIINVVRQVVGTLAAVSLAYVLRLDVIHLIFVVIAFNVLSGVLQLQITHRIVHIRFTFDRALFRRLITGGIPYWSNGVFLTIYVWIDSVMLSVLVPTREVGFYGAPVQAISTLGFLPAIVTTVVFPALSRSYHTDFESARRLTRLSLQGLVAVGLPISAGAALVGPQALALILGAAFRPSAPVIVVLALTIVPSYIATLAYWVLAAADRQRTWAYVMGITAVVNPVINLLAIPYFQSHTGHGSLGAACALLITDTAVGMAGLLLMPRRVLRPFAPIVLNTAKAAVATFAMAVPVWLLRDRPVPVVIFAGAAVFAVAALVLGVFAGAGYDEVWARVAARLRGRQSRQAEAETPA